MNKQYHKRTRGTRRRSEKGNTYRFTQNDNQKISNWKTSGNDGIHSVSFTKSTSIHDTLATEMNKCLQKAHVPEWMTKGRTALIQKFPNNGNAQNNCRRITCLPMMWKILTAQIKEEIFYLLTSCGLFPDEQKGCCKGSRGTVDHLLAWSNQIYHYYYLSCPYCSIVTRNNKRFLLFSSGPEMNLNKWPKEQEDY